MRYLASILMVDTIQDAQRMSHHGVGISGTKIVGGKSLENFTRQTVGGFER